MRIYFTSILFGLLIIYPPGFAQNAKLDSLINKSQEQSIHDTTKILTLLGIADELISPEGHTLIIEHNLDSAILVLNQALLLSKKKNFTKGIGWSYLYLGRAYNYKRLRNQALNNSLKGLQVVENFDDKLMIANCHNDIGNIYLDLQREFNSDRMFQQALYHYRQSRKLASTSYSIDARGVVQIATWNMGKVFLVHKDYDSAIFYYSRGVELGKNTEDEGKISIWIQIDLIQVYKEQGSFNKALQLGRQVLGSASRGETMAIKSLVEDIYPVLAYTYLELNNYDSAYYFISKMIASSRKDVNPANDPNGILNYFYFKKGEYKKAILNAQQIINKASNPSLVPPEMYKIISDSYAKLGNYERAFHYHRIFAELTDSLSKENMAVEVLGQQADYDASKQADAIYLLEKDAEINTLSLAKQKQTQIYFSIILVLSLLIIMILINQYRLIGNAKKEQENFFKELDSLKSHFFANISHEFRTPLTLLLGPLEKRLSVATDTTDRTELTIMHRNASRLLTLVNQLLDLSRLEAGTLKLKGHYQSLNAFISSIASQFSSMADSKTINFQIHADHPVTLFFDADKLEKIITNLLSNAFKFTPSGGTVTLTLTQREPTEHFKNGYVEIVVADSGSGMETEHLGKIFDRFYQADTSSTRGYEGSGIGLALTKELVELHQGSIAVTSSYGKGSCFTVQLPLGTSHLKDSDIEYTEAKVPPIVLSNQSIEVIEHESETVESSRSTVLIVEDNADLRFYLHSNLKDIYEIHEASNGEQGIATALEIIPDLILSDLMMPKMDGLQLCAKLKDNEKTSHIPIILLTAKVDIETKLEGLHTGADDYMAKPFDVRELEARIHNLIKSRRKLQLKFSQQLSLSATEIKVESIEERFLKKVKNTIEAHMSDSTLGVEDLAKEVAMSSIQLYRKLKALTGHTPNELIRSIRMDRAASLLRQHAGNVSEVAYQVGFNNMSYFAKCFKEKFNTLPSEFLNSQE